MVRVLSAMLVACAAAAVGQVLVRYGMHEVGSLQSWAPFEVAAYFWRALTNVFVIGGTVMNAVFYFIFLAVLSRAELTIALPLTALEYVIAAGLSVVFLREFVPALRWAGIALIVAGVILISVGDNTPDPGQRRAGDHERGRPSAEERR